LTACDKVTAPHALEIANDVEQRLWHDWTPSSLGGVIGDGSALNMWMAASDRSSIAVDRDGTVDEIGAVVVERVYVPPNGQGLPVSRRSLVAIPQNTSYGILAFTSTNEDNRDVLEYDNDDLNPRPSLVVAHPHEEDWWIPRMGRVGIEPIEAGSTCPFNNGGSDAADSSGAVTCNVSTYLVHVEGELVRRLDAQNSLIPEALKQRHRLQVGSQRVKGIRFTIHCPAKDPIKLVGKTWYGIECNGNPIAFWRSNSLFAPSLGVDVTRMTRTRPGTASFVYGRTLREGTEKQPPGSRVLRWTLWYPDGTLLKRDSTIDYRDGRPGDEQWLADCLPGMQYGGRRQCIVPQLGLPGMRSPYGVLVLDMEDAARP
jgi:hypothetical protein